MSENGIRFYAFLSLNGQNAFSFALTNASSVRYLSSVPSLDKCLRGAGCGSILVIDPTQLPAQQLESVLTTAKPLQLPVLLYIGDHKGCPAQILNVLRVIEAEVVMRGAREETLVLRRITNQAFAVGAPAQILTRLAARISRLPPSLQECIVGLFAWGELPLSVADFCQRVGSHRRTVERYMVRVGLAGVATLLDSARLTRAWEMRSELRTLGLIAGGAGFESERALSANCRRYVGMPFRRMQAQLTTGILVERIASRNCRERSNSLVGEAPVAE